MCNEILCLLDKISTTIAQAILKTYHSFVAFVIVTRCCTLIMIEMATNLSSKALYYGDNYIINNL